MSDITSHRLSSEGSAAKQRLRSQIIPLEAITSDVAMEMWLLFETFYDDVCKNTFYRDLNAKDGAILMFDETNQVRGFSTYVFYQHKDNKQVVDVLFSGDTIVHPDFWGQNVLHLQFFKLVAQRKFSKPSRKVYWFLISKGFKTYLLMAKNFPQSWPRHQVETPKVIHDLIEHFATRLYPKNWCSQSGLLEFSKSEGRLRQTVAPIGKEELKDPDIAYFLARNPKHASGNELCCLAEISWHFIGLQVFKQTAKSLSFYFKRLCKS